MGGFAVAQEYICIGIAMDKQNWALNLFEF
jgi:hypothetical protein